MKRRLCNLQNSCRAKTHEVPESVSKAADLALKLIVGADVSASPGAQLIADSRVV